MKKNKSENIPVDFSILMTCRLILKLTELQEKQDLR